MEYLDPEKLKSCRDRCVRSYDADHHRIREDPRKGRKSMRGHPSLDKESPAEAIVNRLNKYGLPSIPPPLELRDPPCLRIQPGLIADEEGMMSVARPMTAQAKNFLSNFTMAHLALSSSISTYLELAPCLYVTRERHLVVSVPCEGSPRPGGRRGERIDCAGRAAVELDFDEAERREDVAFRLEQNRLAFREAVERLRKKPLTGEFAAAMLFLDNLVQ